MGAAADFHALSRTSDLLSQIVKPLLSSSTISHLLATLFNDLHFCAHLLDSPQLSFHLSLLLSTPLNSCWLTSPQFHLSNFLSPVEVTQLQTFLFRPVEVPFHSMWFQHSIVLSFSCHVLSFNPTGLLTVTCGSNVQARLGRSIFSRARRAVTSRAAICQERTWAAQPQASLRPAAWKAKRTRTRKQHSCARHRNAAKRGKRRQHSRALFFPASFCYTPKMSPSQYSLRKVSGRPERWETAAWCSVPPRTAAKRADGVPTESIRQAWGATMIAAKHVPQILFEKIAPTRGFRVGLVDLQ